MRKLPDILTPKTDEEQSTALALLAKALKGDGNREEARKAAIAAEKSGLFEKQFSMLIPREKIDAFIRATENDDLWNRWKEQTKWKNEDMPKAPTPHVILVTSVTKTYTIGPFQSKLEAGEYAEKHKVYMPKAAMDLIPCRPGFTVADMNGAND